jgi:hypothetical protein
MWLFETWWPSVGLLVAAAAFAAVWFGGRRRLFAALAVVCLLLIPVALAVERFFVSPAEEVESQIAAVRDAVVRGDVDGTLAFFSQTAEGERALIARGMELADAKDDLHVSDVSVTTTAGDTQAVSTFRANGTVDVGPFGPRHVATYWELSWRKEGGAWKIFQVKRLNPMNGKEIGLLSGE